MATYTATVLEVLQRENPALNLENTEEMTAAARSALFPEAALSYIPEGYDNHFIPAFVYHYLNYELGMPTLSAWRLQLMEKLISNSDYLKQVYAQMDKQIFSAYRTRKLDTNGEENTTRDNTNDTDLTSNVTTEHHNTGKDTRTEHREDNTENTRKATRNSVSENTEERTGHTEGTEGGTENGSENVESSATRTPNLTTTATKSNTRDVTGSRNEETSGHSEGTDKTVEDVTDTSSGSNTRTPNLSTVTTKSGSMTEITKDKYSDTPQNGLTGLLADNYLTNARLTDKTSMNNDMRDSTTESGTDKTVSDNSTSRDGTTTLTKNSDETGTVDVTSTEKVVDAGEDSTKMSGTETTVGTEEHTNEKSFSNNKSSDETGSTTSNGTENITENVTDNGTVTGELTVGSTRSDDANGSEDRIETTNEVGHGEENRIHSNTDNEESYEITIEALLKSQSLMNKVWAIFDDLFMMITESYNEGWIYDDAFLW